MTLLMAPTRWSRGTSLAAETGWLLSRSYEQRGGVWYRGSLDFGGQRANDWWSLRGPHLYCNHSPLFHVLLLYHQEIGAASATIGTNTTDLFLLHIVTAAPCVQYTLCFVTSLGSVSTPRGMISRAVRPRKPAISMKICSFFISYVSTSYDGFMNGLS